MSDPGSPPRRAAEPGEPPQYTRYRARPRPFDRSSRSGRSPLDELRRDRAAPGPARGAGRRQLTAGRVAKWLAVAALGWVLLSLVVFLVSAQIQRDQVSEQARSVLAGGGAPPFTAMTVLVLGSDQRTPDTAEPGSTPGGPSRSDSILLVRTGGGHSARMSIPRDTAVDIPGHGRDKINAAYAIGGAALAVQTVGQYLGIRIDHLVEVNFENFPDLIDAMGGIDYKGGCVVSKINGGFKNGGYTLRLRAGKTHIDGKQALALARTRRNLCNTKEDDRTRVRRQQKLFAAMKSRLLSPFAFIRMPLIAWNAPKAIRTDMSGPTLLGLYAALGTTGTPPTRVLKPSERVTLGNGGDALVVSDEERRREVERFLAG
jgi:LCP family protein required for cell wall assembly